MSQPTAVPQASLPATTSAAVPSPSESASAPAAPAAGTKAMKRPTKSYADPTFPKGPTDSRPDTERLAYVFEKMVWKATGTADAKITSGKCAIANSTLAKPAFTGSPARSSTTA
ncbi:MAG TPA: hypothetical protein VIM10_16545 [Actinopolymorphaceae bacterium]